MENQGDGTYIGEELTNMYHKQKQWIAFHSEVSGKLHVDKGACDAILYHGKSLLPAGIKWVDGDFQIGAVVDVVYNDQIIAKGQVNYSSEELIKSKGEFSEIAMSHSESKRPEAIHRDRLVLSIKEAFKYE
ncbi:glutamate 5-kinase [Gracilibacillus boraciitolerans JCM 21714]|uniref:Glutamate 5-kinase n=1 Tax=Gracilibacillus boraciitolerans JCM 21714 TaxID=1298598 RepID=W4VFD8_9BACI|nr:glutamate 5-kinase [Gracilibacillus boraciitolerans JCM 21714]